MTLQFSSAEHTPVYTKSSADEVGRVTRYVIDTAQKHIAAVHVAGRRGNAQLVDWGNVVGFGPDAVVIDDGDHLRRPSGEYEEQIVAGRLELRGRRVLTDGGFGIGALTDVEFDERSGAIERIVTVDAHVRGDGLLAIGPYAVIVRHASADVPEETQSA